ncbi:hypothetical protein Pcinc_032989 [Petrolisthes cinctipes]|uniref:cysteine--tRNA ligase n=1 Tax=Petrolisthes cinctipes TaxID=88211 RepID=A0AAE1K0A5_PETCI|nr:hypothetical protein Pcinc_032989 [Petrolisthes cinctipes]
MVVVRCLGCLTQRRGLKALLAPTRSTRHRYRHLTHSVVDFRRWHSTGSWVPPTEGHETGITIYNTATQTKVPLLTQYEGLVSWYSCGPTVYDSAHIGHAVTYVRQDIIRRIMTRLFDLNVIMVVGITDIDDKIIKKAQELGVSVQDVSEKYEREFLSDMDRLRVCRPSITPRVTHHIPHIICFIQRILDRSMAYVAHDGSVYFDTEAYGDYGKLTLLPPLRQPSTEETVKKSERDFALWKAAKSGEPYWESPWGKGRPGWHIECSAMASHILGAPLDLHSGGMDLIFSHHENEEAQCCAHHHLPQWCNYWIHTGLLYTKMEEKMSKSLSNTITVNQLLNQHSINTFRFYCLLSHYRNKIIYTPASMSQANAHFKRIQSFLQDANAYINGQYKCAALDEPALKQKLSETRLKVKRSLADDFDTVKAVDAVIDLVSLGNKELQKKAEGSSSLSWSVGSSMVSICSYIYFIMEDVFAITFPKVSDASKLSVKEGVELTDVLDAVMRLRGEVRTFALLQGTHSQELSKSEKEARMKERQPLLKACDDLRTDLLKNGLHIKDHPKHTSWAVTEERKG